MNIEESAESQIPGDDEIEAASAPASAARGKRNLTLLMLALTAGTGVVALVAKRGPQSASAGPSSQIESASREIPATDLPASRQTGTSNDNDIVAKFRFAPADVQVPLSDLKGDPFRMGPSATQPLQLPDDAAENQRREQERQGALAGVQSLHLESIQRDDPHRSCTINGALYQEGQEVDAFVVEEIATTTVVVRKGVYRFELRVR